MTYLHCVADGTAYVNGNGVAVDGDVAVLPYEDGMKVIVRAELASGVKCCTTATVEGLVEGEARAIVDLKEAGDGAKVVSCVEKGGLEKLSPRIPDKDIGPDESEATELEEVHFEADGSTPAELWVSGVKNVPAALPTGGVAILVMEQCWYEEIECGAKDVEHRKQCPKYRKMFIDQHPVAVKLQCGYTDRHMIWQVLGAEDCGEEGIFVHLGKRFE